MTNTDEGVQIDSGSTYLYFETSDMSLQFTYEIWFKGSFDLAGNILYGVDDFGVPLFVLAKVGNDLVLNAGGYTQTFINAYLKFKEDEWTFIGLSIGVKGSANLGMYNLMVYSPSNSIVTGIFYEYVEGMNFLGWAI